MGHISTVFVRVVPAAPGWPRISQAEMFSLLMERNDGNSYHVPLWSDWVDGFVDLQYGANGSHAGSGPVSLWERRAEAGIASIWVRFYPDGGHDGIGEVTGSDVSYRSCRYGFDRIEAEIGGDTEQRRVTGSYQGGNERTALSRPRPYPSPTTPAPRSSYEACAFEPEDAAAHDKDLRARATAIRYYWRGRLVRVATRERRRGWGDAGLDDWDNCVDPAYLAAIAAAARR